MDGQSSLILTGAQVRGHLGAFLLNLQSFFHPLPPSPPMLLPTRTQWSGGGEPEPGQLHLVITSHTCCLFI